MKTPKAPTPKQNKYNVAKSQVWKSRGPRDEGTVVILRRLRFDRDKNEWVADAGEAKGIWIPLADAKSAPSVIQRGDLAFFYKSSLLQIGHVGILIKVKTDQTGLITAEGNTSPNGGRDGEGIYRKDRTWSE
jgi:hypothetical protein